MECWPGASIAAWRRSALPSGKHCSASVIAVESADVMVADRLAPPELLAGLTPHVEVIDAAKIPYGRAMA